MSADSSFSLTILVAAGLYAMAHLLRALRFWLMLQNSNLSLKKTFAVFQITSVLANAIPLILVEPFRWLILTLMAGRKQWVSIISINIFVRLLDVLIAAIPLLLNGILGHDGPQADPSGVVLFFALALGLGLICSARQSLKFVKQVAISRGRSVASLWVVRTIANLEQGFFQFLDQPLSSLVFQVLLTVLIWTVDVLAFHRVAAYFNLEGRSAWSMASLWSSHTFGRLFSTGVDPLPADALWAAIIAPQVVLSGILILAVCIGFLVKGKSWPKRSS